MKSFLKKISAVVTAAMLVVSGSVFVSGAVNATTARVFNFSKTKLDGAVYIGARSSVPVYDSKIGYGFVSKSSNMPSRSVDTNTIEITKDGYSVTQTNLNRYAITDKNDKLLGYDKATDYNYGGMIFRINAPAGGYNIKVNVEDGENTALVSVTGMQTYRIENTKYWDAAKLVENKSLAKWNGNVWEMNYANGKSYIDIELEPKAANVPVVLKSIEITPVDNGAKGDKPTVYLLGDSTLKSYQFVEAPMCGWGQVFDRLFDEDKINIVNYSMGGRSVKQMYQEGRLNDVLMTGCEGDYVLIQSGHNDEKDSTDKGTVADPTARFGTGSTEEMYKSYLEDYYIPAIKARGMIPVLVTPMTRLKAGQEEGYVYKDSFTTEGKEFTKAMREVAKETGVALVDLNQDSVDYLNSLGVKGAEAVVMSLEAGETAGKTNNGSFANGHPQQKVDGTHFKEALAKQYAYMVGCDIYKLSEQYSELAPMTEALTAKAKEAVEADNSALIYTEMAEDCLTGDNAKYRNQIEKMLQLGVMQKDANGSFNPNNAITVSEYINAISQLYNIDSSKLNYKDGTLTREVTAAVNYDVYSLKYSSKPVYMTDFNGTSVTPDDPNYDPNLVSEEAQYYPLRGYDSVKDKDEVDTKLADKVKAAYSLGLIRCDVGVERGKMENGDKLIPKQTVTRALAAKSLYFMYVLGSDSEVYNDMDMK